MSAVYAITATGTNQVARPAKARSFLGIYNPSANILYVAFDAPAVAAATAGQITIPAGLSTTWGPGDAQAIPSGALNFIASAGGTACTVIEG